MNVIDTNALDLSQYLRSGDTILWGDGSGEPIALIEKLINQRSRIGTVRVLIGMSVSGILRPEYADHLNFQSYGAIASASALQRAGVLTLMPCNLSAMPSSIQSGRFPVDAVFVQVSRPGPDGSHSLGFCNCLLPNAIAKARVVIAEINEHVPWSHHSYRLDANDVDVALTSDITPPVLPPISPSDTDRQIAQNIASLINDGDTLQFGIGSIPTALLSALSNHKRLGLHTGLFTDAVVDLINDGVITNENKAIHPGVSVAAFGIGGPRLRDLMHNNPAMLMEPAHITHGAATLSQIDNLIAVNSALEVDLYGQVNAEQVGERYIGTIGGQVDFMHAASTSERGISIIAMPSTTGKSGKSRITTKMNGPFITTARADVDVVITEHGIADLRAQTVADRARSLIQIASPEHRDELGRDWQ